MKRMYRAPLVICIIWRLLQKMKPISKEYRDQLVGKMQRKLQRMNDKQRSILIDATGEKDVSGWIRSLNIEQKELAGDKDSISFVDTIHVKPRQVIISHHEDELVGVEQSYGNNMENRGIIWKNSIPSYMNDSINAPV